MTPEQLHILQHSLGVDKYGQGDMHRNHFCAGGKDEEICRELVTLGYMQTWPNADKNGRLPDFPYFNCSVTDSGKAAMIAESPKPQIMAYEMKDLGYTRTPTTAILRIEMPDGSKWDVPIQAIVDSRDAFYADDHEDTIGGIRANTLDASEIHDWAANEMNWSDVKEWAVRAPDAKPKPVNWEEGWANGEKEVIGAL